MASVLPNVLAEVGPDYVEQVIAFNVKILLTAKGNTQIDPAKALGITRSAVSHKPSGKSTWPVPDVVRTAIFWEPLPRL